MVLDRNVYLENIPLEEARQQLEMALRECGSDQPLSTETVSLREALHRITSEAVQARRSSPHYHAAAMDGYAVMATDTRHATETSPLTLSQEQFMAVNTGDPLPNSANAVIMIEHVQNVDAGIVITDPVAPWQHVRMMGEDMVTTEMVLPAGHRIRPVDIGALAGCGYAEVSVWRKPLVVIIPTGSELVPADANPEPGQITEYNSLVLAAQIEESGGRVEILPITPDQPGQIKATVQDAQGYEPHLILILSGSSAGSRDYTASIIKEQGNLLVHGIAVRPGHPVIMGIISDIPVIGVPGYPVSAALTGEIIIQPLLAKWLGIASELETRPRVRAKTTRKLMSPTGDDDFIRVTLAQVDDKLLATPLSRGAGVITSLVRADALAHVPRFSEGVDMGGELDVILYRTLHEIKQTALTMGSHDPMLDLLAQYVAQTYTGYRLVSGSVGSMGGLVALRRGETHLAGMHLLDEATGDYNLPYIDRQLKSTPVTVITFAHREQGLIVAPGNPQGVQSLDDLPRVRYLNRQRGAGTRILLDYELKQRKIQPESIQGYEREEYTHLAVAAGVASGIADCGLGVRNAAIALDLDFIPVGEERYDLVIPQTQIDHPAVVRVLDVLNSQVFKTALAQQPGYDTRDTGTIQRHASS